MGEQGLLCWKLGQMTWASSTKAAASRCLGSEPVVAAAKILHEPVSCPALVADYPGGSEYEDVGGAARRVNGRPKLDLVHFP
jgi:hypothetical protein